MARRSLFWPDPRVKPPFGAAEIDWGHPLARGLLGYWPFNETGGNAVDLVLGLPAIASGGASRASSGDDLGAVLTTAQYFVAAKPPAFQVAASSMVARVRSTSASVQMVANVNFNGSNVPYAFSPNLSGSYQGYSFYDGAWRNSGVTTDIRGDNLVHTLGGSYDGTTLRYYVDGVQDASAAYTGTQNLANTNTFDIGRYANDGVYFFGNIYHLALYGRALTAAEMHWSAQEPYALLRPIVRRRYFVPTAVATTAIFRRTLAGVGTRTGARQSHGWD